MAFVFKGAYKATTSYSRYDAVSSGDTIYQYINPTAGSGHPLTDDNYWMPYGEGGSFESVALEFRLSRDAYASLDARLDALLAALEASDARIPYGVISGLEATEKEEPDMSVAVSAGKVYMPDGTKYNIETLGSVNITAAHATLDRWDIVYISEDGDVSYLEGTAAASPDIPETPEGGFLLAEVFVEHAVTSITTSAITDVRHMIL